MGMLYFVVGLAIIGGLIAFGLRRRNLKQRYLKTMRDRGIDLENPFK